MMDGNTCKLVVQGTEKARFEFSSVCVSKVSTILAITLSQMQEATNATLTRNGEQVKTTLSQ